MAERAIDSTAAAADAAAASTAAAASSTAVAAAVVAAATRPNVDTEALIAQANAAAAAAKAAAEAAKAAAAAANSAAKEPVSESAPASDNRNDHLASDKQNDRLSRSSGSVEQLACPACGAPLPAAALDTADTLACDYCGATIRVTRRAPAKPAEPPKPTPVNDPSSGKPLAYVMMPEGYHISKAALDATRPTCDFPFAATFELQNDHGAVIRYHSGERYYQYAGLLATQVSQFNPKVKQRNFVTVEEFLDAYAAAFCGGQAQAYVVGQCDLPLYQPVSLEDSRRRIVNDALAEIARSDTYSFEPMKLAGVYFDSTCRIYDIVVNGKALLRLGLGCYLEAVNCTGPNVADTMLGMGGLGALGGLLGGLLGGNSSGGGLLGSLFGGANMQANVAPAAPAAAASAPADSRFFAYNRQTGTLHPTTRAAFSQVSGYGGLGWTVRHIFTLMAPPASFDAELTGAFKEVCSSVKISEYVYDRWAKAAEADAQALRQKTQMTLAQQQAQFEAMQAFNRAQQQAFDSYQQAWWDRENSTWAANRARDRAASSVSTADKWSEAIRGVNTYVRSDGSEVEVSVAADTAWTNASGDVLGGSSTFNPGSGWTQMDRKR